MLAPEGMDPSFIVSSLFRNVPQSYDSGIAETQVDLLCNGKVSETTPLSAIGTVKVLSFRSLRPNDPAWE